MSDLSEFDLGAQGGVDRLGLHTYQLPFTAVSLEEAATLNRGLYVNGIPERSRSWQQNAAGLYIVTMVFEGVSDPLTFDPQFVYGLKSSFREEPIEAHPKIEEIKNKYYGKEQGGRILFPITIPAAAISSSSSGSRGKNNNTQKKNPFFGVEKFNVLVVTWTRSYVRSAIPDDVLENVGKVIKSPPGGPPRLPDREDWLVMPPQASQRGNMFTITEEYQLLEEGAPTDLYTTGSGVSSTTNG